METELSSAEGVAIDNLLASWDDPRSDEQLRDFIRRHEVAIGEVDL